MSRKHGFFLLGGIIILLLLPSCHREEGEVVRISPTEFTIKDQIKIGNFINNKIIADTARYHVLRKDTYEEAYDYVSYLLSTLLNTPSISHRNTYQWEIAILDDYSKRDAFIIPGGKIYIYTGLLKFIESENQFLSVIGHEIYFADTDLLIDRLKDKYGGVTLGDILLDNRIENVDQFSSDISALSFDTGQIKSADDFSVELLCPFEYDSKGIIQLLQKANASATPVDWLDKTDFDINERISNIEEKAADCGNDDTFNRGPYQNFLKYYLP